MKITYLGANHWPVIIDSNKVFIPLNPLRDVKRKELATSMISSNDFFR